MRGITKKGKTAMNMNEEHKYWNQLSEPALPVVDTVDATQYREEPTRPSKGMSLIPSRTQQILRRRALPCTGSRQCIDFTKGLANATRAQIMSENLEREAKIYARPDA